MNKDLEIKTTKVDYLKLIQLALKKKDWGKIYTIHNYADVAINVCIKEMNFKKNMATFELTVNYNGGNVDNYYNTYDVQYYLENFKVEDFESIMDKKIIRLINQAIDYIAKREAQAEYRNLQFNYWDITEDKIKDSEYASEWNKIQKIDSDIREKFEATIKEAVKDALNKPYDDKVREYEENYVMKDSELQNFLKMIDKGDEQ